MNPIVIAALVFGIFVLFILSILILAIYLKRSSKIKYYVVDDQLVPIKGGSYTVDEQAMKTLAKRLTSNGWVLHSKPTCPWCIRQIEMFGHSSKYLNIKECDEGCEGIHLYPTWTNGERQEPGTRSIENLKDLLNRSF